MIGCAARMTRPGSTIPRLLLTSGLSSKETGVATPSKTTAMPILRMRLPSPIRETDDLAATAGSVCLVIVAKDSVSRIGKSLRRKDGPGQVRKRDFPYENLAAPAGRSSLIHEAGN